MKRALVILISILILGCSEEDNSDIRQYDLQVDENATLKVSECLDIKETAFELCLDFVEDSRCPTGVVCIWEGDAVVGLSLKSATVEKDFLLHTNENFPQDTLIDGLKIVLLNVSPYPETPENIMQDDYSVALSISGR
ncbi:hypothetical protein [Gramella sp. AN32]|uniref:Lipoprotein n=1 Tax=Christiangramia antarctica TaxID=2058158 RepID=A0ABW5XC89_9FLAO|nr:hypothetical protein [Gramella sp. AN32]